MHEWEVMGMSNAKQLELIPSELEDQDTTPANYDIVTYPADYTLEGLVNKLNKTILISGFQRKYVWTIKQASRLIESFILGLPVPAIFLYSDPETNKFIVVDGQQRLMSVFYYFSGYFGEPDNNGKKTIFKLQGLNEKSPYNQLTYEELRISDESAFNRLNESVLRAFIVKQLKPQGRSSVYHIFERLNTGGTQLVGQEIRNCIYDGSFNKMLQSLNKTKEWRAIFGSKLEGKHLQDVELILRFFALYDDGFSYSKPMKDFLSEYMRKHKSDTDDKIFNYTNLFIETSEIVKRTLGDKPFHIRKGLNVAAFDCVFVAFAKNRRNIPPNIIEHYEKLKNDKNFQDLIISGTTDELVVRDRLILTEKILFH